MSSLRCLVLSGGVGGARLAEGLYRALEPAGLTVLGNTADDFDWLGLRLCPDLDTLLYTLSGRHDEERGWGRAGETWRCLAALEELGAPSWFQVGDQDLATHLVRTEALRRGMRLTEVTALLAESLGVNATLLPMCDEPVRTRIRTAGGLLDFQDYFVRRGQQDRVLGVEYQGLEGARVTAEALQALQEADLVVLGPSNPFVSLGPILAVPGLRPALEASQARKVAISPILAGQALKGPAAAMLDSLGHEVSALGVARLYAGLVHEFLMDTVDGGLAPAVAALGMEARVLPTVMHGSAGRLRLAQAVLTP